MSDEQIAKTVNRSRTTLSNWKKDNKFKQAQIEYRRVAIDSYVPDAIKRLHKLATGAKSEMVSLQAAQSILSMAGFGSVDSSPELEQAKIEKAKAQVRNTKAEAEIKQPQTKPIKENGSGNLTVNIVPFGDDADGS